MNAESTSPFSSQEQRDQRQAVNDMTQSLQNMSYWNIQHMVTSMRAVLQAQETIWHAFSMQAKALGDQFEQIEHQQRQQLRQPRP